jgi:hypothetical protein
VNSPGPSIKKITKAGLLSNERLRQPHALIACLENAGNGILPCRRSPRRATDEKPAACFARRVKLASQKYLFFPKGWGYDLTKPSRAH